MKGQRNKIYSLKDNSVVKRRRRRLSNKHDASGEWLAKRALVDLENEKYRGSLGWAIRGCKAYGNEVCVAVRKRIEAAPWDRWKPHVAIQRTQLTKIHDKQFLWMQIAKRLEMDRNIALMICGWISTM